MTETTVQRTCIFVLRIALGWVFLWAAMRQLSAPNWSAGTFLAGAQTFPGFYKSLAQSEFLPAISFMVKWGHLLIGLSLISGLGTRVSAAFGAALLILYYIPRLHFPYVGEGVTNFIVEYHLVYATCLIYLAAVRAGRVWGLDGWLADLPPIAHFFARHPRVQQLVG